MVLHVTFIFLSPDHLSNGDIIKEEEEFPLISFEDPELLEPTNGFKPHPPPAKEHRELLRKKLKLLLSKGVFFGLGALLFAAGCVLVVSFQHGNVDEMCILDGGHTTNATASAVSVLPSTVLVTSTPDHLSPTRTILTDLIRTTLK